MITIRYLEPFEKDKTLPLWKESFPEDKPQFLDYYYKEKQRIIGFLLLKRQILVRQGLYLCFTEIPIDFGFMVK